MSLGGAHQGGRLPSLPIRRPPAFPFRALPTPHRISSAPPPPAFPGPHGQKWPPPQAPPRPPHDGSAQAGPCPEGATSRPWISGRRPDATALRTAHHVILTRPREGDGSFRYSPHDVRSGSSLVWRPGRKTGEGMALILRVSLSGGHKKKAVGHGLDDCWPRLCKRRRQMHVIFFMLEYISLLYSYYCHVFAAYLKYVLDVTWEDAENIIFFINRLNPYGGFHESFCDARHRQGWHRRQAHS